MNSKIKYEFSEPVWHHPSTGGWHFVSLPKNIAAEIRQNLKSEEEGWGKLKAKARIGTSEWQTAMWFDTKMDTYLLPLKVAIRKKENIEIGMILNVLIIL